MDYAACHVVYVDKRAREERFVRKDGLASSAVTRSNERALDYSNVHEDLAESEEVQMNVQAILSVFNGVWVCTSGTSCMAKLSELNESIGTDLKPTLVILETFVDADVEGHGPRRASRELATPSPTSQHPEWPVTPEPDNLYSFALLQHISAEVSFKNLSKLVVPIAMIQYRESGVAMRLAITGGARPRPSSSSFGRLSGSPLSTSRETTEAFAPVESSRMLKCLDAGAIDVLTSPLQKDRVYGLAAHAYRAHIEATRDQTAFLPTKRLRKRSWVGVDDEKPFAYLRESMVSGLMMGICKPESVPENFDHRELFILGPRQGEIARAIGTWRFSAHDFSDDELVHAAFLMLQHALQMPELEKWRLPAGDLKNFLMASRVAYNAFVLYHNFRHVVDVMQAVFVFLLEIGILPPYQGHPTRSDVVENSSSVAVLLTPFDALTLLISAIGHDVGHPGVNNAFLVALNAPLAQLYNDNSVLEAFHCAAYSQILRRYWNAAFVDTDMRRLMIQSILATDMGVHFKYMEDLGNLQQKVHDNHGTDGWSPQVLQGYRTLICGLLIKCADISNVARSYEIAAGWTDLLQLEFAKQGEMEIDVGLPTTLFGGPPELGNVMKLAHSQIGFMNVFAKPLFEAVTDIIPAMGFAVDEISKNVSVWQGKIEQEKFKEIARGGRFRPSSEGILSPRSNTPNQSTVDIPELSHPDEGPSTSATSQSLPILSPNPQVSLPNRESRRSSVGSISALLAGASPSQTGSHNPSRRSSLGSPTLGAQPLGSSFAGYASVGSSADPVSFSRRSSGAFPSASIVSPNLQTRRSSNTLPSQLQLGLGPGQLPFAAATPSAENIQPGRPGPASSDFPAHDVGAAATAAAPASGPSSRDSNSGGGGNGGGGGQPTHRGSKYTDSDTSPTKHQPARHFPNRHHGSSSNSRRPSTLDRSYSPTTSNGAHTTADGSLSHFPTAYSPASPSGTQATSFLTVDSDSKDRWPEHEGAAAAATTPAVVDLDRPGSGYNGGGKDADAKVNTVKTSVVGAVGNASANANGNGSAGDHGGRVVQRKGSRFLHFWKKKSKSLGSSP